MMKKFKFDYDFENDSLFIYDSKSKSKASVEVNDLIIDYDSKKQISSIELFNASKFFNDLSIQGTKISRTLLSKMSECKLDFIPRGNFFLIKILFKVGDDREFYTPVVVPSINESSPAAFT